MASAAVPVAPVDVIGVGDVDVDIYLGVDRLPGADEKLLANAVDVVPGGMVANFLVAASRLGMRCRFHGVVGDDDFGRRALRDMRKNCVDITGAVTRRGGQTYFCVIFLNSAGEKSLVVAPTDCLFPLPDDLRAELIADARHLHTTAGSVETAVRAASLARSRGLTVSLDLEKHAAAAGPEVVSALCADVDFLFVQEQALPQIGSAATILERARALQQLGPAIVCVTMGADGALILDRERVLRSSAAHVDVLDTTGAGDCFAAGFVRGYLSDWPLERVVRLATATAAMNITALGGHAGAPPRLSDAEAFLQVYDVDVVELV